MELVINLHGASFHSNPDASQGLNGPVIAGAHSEPFLIDTVDQAALLGVHFKPGGAFPFLGLPAGELHNTHVSLETLWKRKAVELRDRLLEAKTDQARFRVLEQFLTARIVRSPARHPAVAFALREFKAVPHARAIAAVADHAGLSHRQFIEVFRDKVGLTPKQFCRIQRFQKALRDIGRGHTRWLDVALACGYYDQAHFIHEFQFFSGLSPTAYLCQKGEHLNHIPLAE